jgi:hypothetical protein
MDYDTATEASATKAGSLAALIPGGFEFSIGRGLVSFTLDHPRAQPAKLGHGVPNRRQRSASFGNHSGNGLVTACYDNLVYQQV